MIHSDMCMYASGIQETVYRKRAFTTREFCKYRKGSSSWNVFFYFHTSLQEANALIEKVEAEQNALYSYQKFLGSSKIKKSRIPPPPILLARTHCSVTLKPAPFISEVKVPCPPRCCPHATRPKRSRDYSNPYHCRSQDPNNLTYKHQTPDI